MTNAYVWRCSDKTPFKKSEAEDFADQRIYKVLEQKLVRANYGPPLLRMIFLELKKFYLVIELVSMKTGSGEILDA